VLSNHSTSGKIFVFVY